MVRLAVAGTLGLLGLAIVAGGWAGREPEVPPPLGAAPEPATPVAASEFRPTTPPHIAERLAAELDDEPGLAFEFDRTELTTLSIPATVLGATEAIAQRAMVPACPAPTASPGDDVAWLHRSADAASQGCTDLEVWRATHRTAILLALHDATSGRDAPALERLLGLLAADRSTLAHQNALGWVPVFGAATHETLTALGIVFAHLGMAARPDDVTAALERARDDLGRPFDLSPIALREAAALEGAWADATGGDAAWLAALYRPQAHAWVTSLGTDQPYVPPTLPTSWFDRDERAAVQIAPALASLEAGARVSRAARALVRRRADGARVALERTTSLPMPPP